MENSLGDIRNAIIRWAIQYGVLADSAPRPDELTSGRDQLSFLAEHAEFFRTRKITRVTVNVSNSTITIYSRLAISKIKAEVLAEIFKKTYEPHARLRFDVSRPFKIDHAVQEYGLFEPIRRYKRRICCGSSIGLGNQRNAGTLTALATSTEGSQEGAIYGLSCNHVIGGCSTARPGTPIVVPGILDVSAEHNEVNVIGEYVSTARMSQGLPSVTNIDTNRDLAFFAIHKKNTVTSMQGSGPSAYDTPRSIANPTSHLLVKKWGRSTGLTHGKITSILTQPEPIDYDVISYYGPMNSQKFKGTVYFGTLYEIQSTGSPFSLGGDSGALVVTDEDEPKAVGIVVAGQRGQNSLVLPIEPALNELKLRLLSNHNI